MKETGANFSIDWQDLLKIDKLNVNDLTRMNFEKINILLDSYAPLKRIVKHRLRFGSKP